MKKLSIKSILLPLLAVFTLFLLGACGQSTKKGYLQLINQDKKTDIRLIVEYQGDKILSTDSTSVIYYEGTGLSKEQLKKVIDEYDKKFKDVKGFFSFFTQTSCFFYSLFRSIFDQIIIRHGHSTDKSFFKV